MVGYGRMIPLVRACFMRMMPRSEILFISFQMDSGADDRQLREIVLGRRRWMPTRECGIHDLDQRSARLRS